MPSAEDRKANALAGIERHLKDLVRVQTAISQNLMTFAKIVQTSKDETLDSGDKLLTPEEWMRDIGRWWNYKDVVMRMGDGSTTYASRMKITKKQFFDFMAKCGSEVSDETKKEGE